MRPPRIGLLTCIALAMLTVGCVGDQSNTATFDSGSTTERSLPEVTTTSVADPAGSDSTTGTTTSTVPPLPPLQGLSADVVADGFDEALFVTGAPGTDALFVVEQRGRVQLVTDGTRADAPFLDITDQVGSSGNEQGLLGLAFHPDYQSNGRFFAYWTDKSGNSRLGEFSATEPTVADPDSLQIVLEVDQPARNHNGGMIAFDSEGLLYVALGDGGGSPGNRSQDTSTLLGSILRVDVDSVKPYAIPPDNPFGNEIWVYGLRNPWRFSIDPDTRLMYIGDVGQDRFEEIDVVSIDTGASQTVNFGWPAKEGDSCFGSGCEDGNFTDPVLQYPHPQGCSVTGGWVYRGSDIPEIQGHYFYADYCGGLVRSFRLEDSSVADQIDWSTDLAALGRVSSFGTDNNAELYATNWSGQLLKIIAAR